MAQFGRALRSGRRGRRFKSCRADLFELKWQVNTKIFEESAMVDSFFVSSVVAGRGIRAVPITSIEIRGGISDA